MRDINRVMAFLLREVIPQREDTKALRERLEHHYKHTFYIAPECQGPEGWSILCGILGHHVGGPGGCEWKQRVRRIVNDEEQLPADFRELEQ